jgi:hypothetical protein
MKPVYHKKDVKTKEKIKKQPMNPHSNRNTETIKVEKSLIEET